MKSIDSILDLFGHKKFIWYILPSEDRFSIVVFQEKLKQTNLLRIRTKKYLDNVVNFLERAYIYDCKIYFFVCQISKSSTLSENLYLS